MGLKNRIQNSLTNDSMRSFNRILERLFKYPDLFLVGIWGMYLLLDYCSLKILKFPIDPIFASANLLFGFLFSCILYYLLLPWICLKGHWKSGLLLTLLVILILSGAKFSILYPEVPVWEIGIEKSWLEFLRIIQFQGFTFSIWILMTYFLVQQENRKKEVMIQELQVQHQSLQVMPHFVLNMLTEIYSKASICSKELSEEMKQFSMILKYSYKDLKMDNFLSEEIETINAFVFCQKTRFGNRMNLRINFYYDEPLASKLLLPKMLLITLFSDVFKHGDYLNPNFPCELTLRLKQSELSGNILLSITIYNAIQSQFRLEQSGFGIQAVRNILSHYFEEDFGLFYDLSESEFSLLLWIDYGS